MKFNNKGQQGFSLVELMVVVAIIGVLAALAVPKFQTFQAKAKQSEVKNSLSHIYTLQQSYFGDHDAFAVAADKATMGTVLGFQAQGKVRYGYATKLNGTGFKAQGLETTAGTVLAQATQVDTWVVDDGKSVCAVADVVLNQTAATTNGTLTGGAACSY